MTGEQLASDDVMDRDQVWQVIDAQRLSLAGLLEQLSADEWRQPSLCTGWTIRDVAAQMRAQENPVAAAHMGDVAAGSGHACDRVGAGHERHRRQAIGH